MNNIRTPLHLTTRLNLNKMIMFGRIDGVCSLSSTAAAVTKFQQSNLIINPSTTTTTSTSGIEPRRRAAAAAVVLTPIRNFGVDWKQKGVDWKQKQRDEIERKKELRRQKPPRYPKIPPKVINGISREERLRQSAEFDKEAADVMKEKMKEQNKIDMLRFDMTDLQMSDRVKKLFNLTNGNQREVIKAQKERGMKLFEQRDGDTGSSAVQVIALTTRIQQLQTHVSKHRKDHATKRGLNRLYVRRRKVLDYMERKDFDSYRRVVKTLGLIR